ncbi:HNH endonuclease [Aminobacter sp. LjRoot7]|uniref:HNH endonuclease n=1 Tax=Aminobacter sp. LjRoot7 TaxID=3342335 RepID=UPI003F5058E3
MAKQRTAARRCILCQNAIPEKTKPEHVLLNALGGRMTVRDVICPACNHEMGIGPDEDLAKTTEFLRNICQLKAGDGDSAPQIRGLETDGQRFDLVAGMRPRLRAPKPLELSFTEEEILVSIEAYSDAEAEKLLTGAATAIAKKLGKLTQEAVAAIKQDMLRDKRSSYQPAPEIRQSVQFGVGRSQQSKAKACLVLWAKVCGNEEVNSPRYDAIRRFIRTGENPEGGGDLIEMDTRTLPDVPVRFGTNPNLIWVGSDQIGRTYGYFRLYGAIGWRFLLCDVGAPSDQRHCLISNPFDNKEWALLQGSLCSIEKDWVWARWEVERPQFDQVQARLTPMLRYAHDASRRDWLRELIVEGLRKAGCKEGEAITEEHVRNLAEFISPALTAYVLKTNVPSS